MLSDQYDNAITTTSQAARDHFIEGVDRCLAADPHHAAPFEAAIAEDPGFAIAHAGLARARQFEGDMAGAKAAIQDARATSKHGDTREQSHIHALGLMIDGKTADAYAAIRAHVDDHPRDAMLAQTCSSVFGLIGFSGKPGREAETLAYVAGLLPHYGEDWWCLSQYAFALSENGDQDRADTTIERSLGLRARSAHSAHVRSHIYYEMGETDLGLAYLDDWIAPYDHSAYMHGHLAWHSALWALETGDVSAMWQRLDRDIDPAVSNSMPINVLTDMAALLYRAELAGIEVPAARWQTISDYALKFFPKTGLGFTDFHAALAHAMAGNGEALMAIIENPNPVTGDIVTPVAQAFREMAAQNWAAGIELLVSAMGDHARLGGSRAQRDLLEFALLHALLKMGKDDEARHMLRLRRPALVGTRSVHGLNAH